MHIIQMAQEQHAIYFGYAFFRRFRQILQEVFMSQFLYYLKVTKSFFSAVW